MKSFFARRRSKEPGWLALSVQPGGVSYAHGVCESGGKSSIRSCGTRALDGSAKELEHFAKDLGADRYRCLTVLPPSDYQLLLVEAPNVPATELKTAVRWRLKDMLEYHVDDATIDVLDIPVDASGTARGHSMYAVAARNDVIQSCIERFTAAHVPLSVIDIVETAQRNIAALFEPPNRGIALLHLSAKQALLTINYRGELYMARRTDFGSDQILEGTPAQRDEAMNRIVLELQRSFDHLDRQFPYVTLAKLLVGPEPRDSGLLAYLAQNLAVPVERVQLGEVIDFAPGAGLEGEAAWRMFHVLGAALRNETKAL